MREREMSLLPYLAILALILAWMFFAVEPRWTVLVGVGIAALSFAAGYLYGFEHPRP